MLKELKKNFERPTNRYGPAPFWFWNGDLDRDELLWQVREMREKGLSGFVMHSRYGRRIDYMSETFFDRIGAVVEESAKIGVSPVVYDEDDWPSGMSGTKVLDDHPEYRHKQLAITRIRCAGQPRVKKQFETGAIYRAFACKIEKDDEDLARCIVGEYRDVTDCAQGSTLSFDNREGYDLVVAFNFEEVNGYVLETTFPKMKGYQRNLDTWSWYFPFGEYVDLFNPEAVAYFLQTTGDEYFRRFGEAFGSVISAFFTDEPGFYTVMRGEDTAVPWSDIFAETFEREFGYDIGDKILALAVGTQDKSCKTRYDFWKHITDLFQNSFIRQYNDWCVAHGVKLMGHFRLCYPQLVWQRNYAGDAMHLFKYMDIPGVDRLDTPGICARLATEDWVWQIEDKACSSIGHQYGKERRMTESFAIGGWEYRFADMKRVTDWQYMMGMNLMVPHAFHYSLSAQRKHECPPSFFYQNPLWDRYGEYAAYLSRLGEMMIGGRNVADIAVLYPMTTIWADDVPQAEVQDLINDIDRDFAYTTDLLLRNQLDYDILNEADVADCAIADGHIQLGDADYKLLVVPPMLTIRRETEAFLKEFLEQGGHIVFLSLIPAKDTNCEPLGHLNALAKAEFGYDEAQALTAYRAQAECSVKTGLGGRIAYVGAGVLRDNDPDAPVLEAVEGMIDRDFSLTQREAGKGNLYYNHHVQGESTDVYFVHNADEERGYHLDLRLRAAGTPYLFYPEDGRVQKAPFFRQENGCTYFDNFYLDRLQSVFFVLDVTKEGGSPIQESNLKVVAQKDGKLVCCVPYYEKEGYAKREAGVERFAQDKREYVLPRVWERRLVHPNVLILDHWTMIQDEAADEYVPPESWDSSGSSAIQYVTEFVVKDASVPLKAVFDRLPEIDYDGKLQPIDLYCNDVRLERFSRSTFLDHDMYETDLSALVREGANTIKMVYEHKFYGFEGKSGIHPVSMIWDPAFIIGDFNLEPEQGAMNKYAIVPQADTITTGDWTGQGLPNYNGAVQFRQTVTLSAEDLAGRRCLIDGGDARECLDVTVNGTLAARRIWMPYVADITDFLREGENEIVLEVRSTPKNIMNKSMFPYGLLGDVKLVTVKEYTIAE